MSKKLKIMIIGILIIAFSFATLSYAVVVPNITAESVSAGEGEEVTVNVTLNEEISMAAFETHIKFDTSKLEVTKTELGTALTSLSAMTTKTDPADANTAGEVVFTSASASDQTLSAGTIGKITFKVKSGATGDVSLQVVNNIKNESGTVVDVNATAGKVDITATSPSTPSDPGTTTPSGTETEEGTTGTSTSGATNKQANQATGKIPQAGTSNTLMIVLGAVVLVGTVGFIKYKRLKEI